MDELPQRPCDPAGWKVQRLAELFPGVVTESHAQDGTLVRAVDFDRLRQDLSGHVIEGQQERYQLDWPGKRAALAAANAPIAKTLLPVLAESVDFDTTKNLVIEGDNLDALKLLQQSYTGAVKLIYIDPPYNTGNDFVYNDRFTKTTAEYLEHSGQVDGGDRLTADTEVAGRFHSDWLSMMYPRLKLARELLANDGIGLVSIDGNEIAQLKLMLAELYGAENVVATFVWVSNLKGRQIADGGPAGTHEYILCFARDRNAISQFRGSAETFRQLMPNIYKAPPYAVKYDANGPYVTKNELYNTNSKFNENTAPTMVFRIHYHPDSGEVLVSDIDDPSTPPGFVTAMPHPNARAEARWHAWRWSRAKILSDHRDLEFQIRDGQLRIWTKIRDIDGMAMKDVIIGPSTMTGQAELAELGLDRVFETPKPVSLLSMLISVTTGPNDLVMDFFAGSGATAHAVMDANRRDSGRRRFLLVQQSEETPPASVARRSGFHTVAELCRERIRRAGRAVTAAAEAGDLDVGFRALKVEPADPPDNPRVVTHE